MSRIFQEGELLPGLLFTLSPHPFPCFHRQAIKCYASSAFASLWDPQTRIGFPHPVENKLHCQEPWDPKHHFYKVEAVLLRFPKGPGTIETAIQNPGRVMPLSTGPMIFRSFDLLVGGYPVRFTRPGESNTFTFDTCSPKERLQPFYASLCSGHGLFAGQVLSVMNLPFPSHTLLLIVLVR